MTWRRFTTLLRGLGPWSACATRAELRRMEERSGQKVHVVDGTPDEASAVFTSLFGGLASGQSSG